MLKSYKSVICNDTWCRQWHQCWTDAGVSPSWVTINKLRLLQKYFTEYQKGSQVILPLTVLTGRITSNFTARLWCTCFVQFRLPRERKLNYCLERTKMFFTIMKALFYCSSLFYRSLTAYKIYVSGDLKVNGWHLKQCFLCLYFFTFVKTIKTWASNP